MGVESRIATVARTWTPTQRLHPGNVAWHETGCDGAPPTDLTLGGEGWYADVWRGQRGAADDVDAHFSPELPEEARASIVMQVRDAVPRGSISLVTGSAMAYAVLASGAVEEQGPFFLLQHRRLDGLEPLAPPAGYEVVRAGEAGETVRVEAHRRAWDPARIKRLLGLPVTGDEPSSSFSASRYRALREVSIYRPELDLVALTPDGAPAAFALGWYDERSRSVLFEPVGSSPDHARRGLSRALCTAVMTAACELGATQAVVGPRGDDAYPAPRALYGSLGFSTVARTATLTWGRA